MALKRLWVPTLFLPILLGILFGIRMMPKIWLMMSVSLLTFGLMVAGNLSLISMLRLRGLVLLFILQLSSLIVIIGAMFRIFDDPHEGSSHIFSGVLGPIQSVQRAEYWGGGGRRGGLFLLCKPIREFILVSTI